MILNNSKYTVLNSTARVKYIGNGTYQYNQSVQYTTVFVIQSVKTEKVLYMSISVV